ncbi:hypothetical protein PSEUDO9AG_40948 [Pseudomonas sp. 9Ag]|nr:hypothetical protein PSEUDO9AG_40948 [Pseudomonas sp. 9Ag]
MALSASNQSSVCSSSMERCEVMRGVYRACGVDPTEALNLECVRVVAGTAISSGNAAKTLLSVESSSVGASLLAKLRLCPSSAPQLCRTCRSAG